MSARPAVIVSADLLPYDEFEASVDALVYFAPDTASVSLR